MALHNVPQALDHWQTGIAGVLAFVAGVGTVVAAIWAIWVTRLTASKQIEASRVEADRVIDATREQTRATFKQTEATVTLDRLHEASEALAFHAMLAAAMDRVLAEAAWAKETYPQYVGQAQGASIERLPTPLSFASASPRARLRNCAPLASGGAGT